MGHGRRNVLIVTFVAAVLMVLFPPWETAETSFLDPAAGSFVGYSAIFMPPRLDSSRLPIGVAAARRALYGRYGAGDCVICWRVLLTQFIALGALGAAGLVMTRHRAT